MLNSDYGNLPHEDLLTHVHEGMEVFDSQGDKIGKVEFVQMGSAQHPTGNRPAESPDEGTHAGTGIPVTAQTPATSDADVPGFAFGGVPGIFSEDQVPETLAKRLAMSGYIRLDSQRLLHSDRYILSEQVDRVEGDRVFLKVAYDNLINP